MTHDDPRHGTWAGYVAGCRSDCCREAARLYQKRRVYEGTPRLVSSLGLRRRIQALACLGWDMYAIAREADIGRETVRQWTLHETVQRRTHERMAEAYERLSMRLPPETTRMERLNASRTRNRAARNGWAPPLAWDDIDHDEHPRGMRDGAATPRADELRDLIERGGDLHDAVREIGIDRESLRRWCDRHDCLDLYAALARREKRTA